MKLKRLARGPFLYITLGLLVVLALSSMFRGNGGFDTSNTATVLEQIKSGNVVDNVGNPAMLLDKEQQVRVELKNGKKLQSDYLGNQGTQFADAFAAAGVHYDVKVSKSNPLLQILFSFLPFVIILGLLFFFMNQMQGGGSRVMQFGKSKAKLVSKDTPKTTFADVAGADEAIEELHEIKEFLQEPAKFQAVGAKIPKGVLLYGPPGTGKTELAKVVAQAAGLALYEVESSDRDGNALSGRDRYRSLQIAQVFLKGSTHSALLFDEVEDVFPPISSEAAQLMARSDQLTAPGSGSGSVSGKAWVNQILESNTVPTLWVTNRIEQIDPAFRRRFAYHLELNSPPPGAREGVVRKTLEGVQISEAFMAKLTARKGLTPAQIRTAVRFARLAQDEALADGEKPAAVDVANIAPPQQQRLERLIERQLKNADVALGTQQPSGGRRNVTTYDLAMLNVESRFALPRIVEALKVRGHGSLCFYGAPGTGKTALAEHMAEALERPLIIKRASDLMSKYVGETEQKMAAMFREAELEKAVLLLDEADSFLQDRRGAQRTYEVTEVNEMLQGMERHNGVFICTTNLLDSLDAAALRRFTFKIEFRPLTATQREQMFTIEALGGDAALMDVGICQRLARLTQLCLGDFAAVKRQTDILASELSADEFLAQLEAEHRIKPDVRHARGMGFVQG